MSQSGRKARAPPTTGEARRSQRRIPGTSTPTRLTSSWNIWMWLHSSVISWRQ